MGVTVICQRGSVPSPGLVFAEESGGVTRATAWQRAEASNARSCRGRECHPSAATLVDDLKQVPMGLVVLM